jgi:drug/metabolite transporter (DMT)-like permease
MGHLLFLGSALAFACYTVAMRRARLDGLRAAAISAVGSMLLYMPPYAIAAGASIFEAPASAIALQALVQGLLTAVVSYIVYGLAVGILGASSGSAFAASCPAMTALMAIPILGEWPTTIDWTAITLISVSVSFVSGGPVPERWRDSSSAD